MAAELLYLSQQDIVQIGLSAPQMLELTTEVLHDKQAGRTEMPPKLGVHPRPQSFLHAMPGYLERLDSVGLKLVSYYPGNSARGCDTINAMMMLNDAATGQPLAIMDANWITAYRTATISALSCKLLCGPLPQPSDSSVMVSRPAATSIFCSIVLSLTKSRSGGATPSAVSALPDR